MLELPELNQIIELLPENCPARIQTTYKGGGSLGIRLVFRFNFIIKCVQKAVHKNVAVDYGSFCLPRKREKK